MSCSRNIAFLDIMDYNNEDTNEDISLSETKGINCKKVEEHNSPRCVQAIQEQFAEEENKDGTKLMDELETKSELLKGLKQETLLLKIHHTKDSEDPPELPDHFQLGNVLSNGDCFFDSFAKGLKLLKPHMEVSVKSLREVCTNFAQRQLDANHSWLTDALRYEAGSISEYIPRIKFTANDIEQKAASVIAVGLSAPIWGRSDIEGRILCKEYGVKLHIVEKHVVEGKVMWLHQIIDDECSKSVGVIDYSDRNMIHILNNGEAHFQPILETQKINVPEKDIFTKPDVYFQKEKGNKHLHICKIATSKPKPENHATDSEKKKLKESEQKVQESLQEMLEQSSSVLPIAIDFNLNNSCITSITRSEVITSVQSSQLLTRKYQNMYMKNEEDETAFKAKNRKRTLEVRQPIFRRRQGTSGISGHLYEINLIILFLLQASKRPGKFFLATNMEEVGEFDDIIFKYRSEMGKVQVILLQAKHRENPGKDKITIEQLFSESRRGGFNLQKYFKSYCTVKQLFSEGKDNQIFGGKFDNVEFIIYTNAACTFKKNEKSIEKVALEPESIFNWSEKSCPYYKVLTSGEKNEKIISALQYSSDCKRLARELAESIFSSKNVIVDEEILRDYHIPLAREVIQKESGASIGYFKESFLHTNSHFRSVFFEEVQKKEEFAGKSVSELISLLQSKSITLCNNFRKLNIAEGRYPECLPNDVVFNHDIKEFLSKLKLFVDQCNEEELNKILKLKIREEYKVAELDIDSVFSEIQTKVLDWWKNGNYYLTENNRLFQDAARVSIKFDVIEPVNFYTGRKKELEDLHKILQDGCEAVILQMASVVGLGGIGKSELARKYISEHNKDYDDNVIWINADNDITISDSFRRLAQDKLQVSTTDESGKEKEMKLIVEDVYSFFAKRHRKCLFVFDNAGKYKAIGEGEGIDKFLPSDNIRPFGNNKPFVLITSRYQEWGEIKSLPLDIFTEEEAIEFVQKALHNVVELKENEVKELVKELQYLPLALSQSVAYIKMENEGLYQWEDRKFTINKYLEEFKEKANDLLAKSLSETSERYTETVMTTWLVTIEKIKQKVCGKQALKVLSVIAYLSSNNIPMEQIFQNLICNKEERRNAIELLDEYSIAHLGCGNLNIHRLLQHVTRIELEKQGKDKRMVEITFELLHESFHLGKDRLDHSKQKKLLTHFEAFLSHLEDFHARHPEDKHKIEGCYMANVLLWMAEVYSVFGNSRRKLELLERSLPIIEEYHPLDNVAVTLVNLSGAYDDLGDIKNRKNLLERALEIQEKFHGTGHINVARTLEGLGKLYGDIGDYQKHKEFIEKALEIQEKYYGSDHFEVAETLVNLSNAFKSLGDSQKQKDLLERALPILEKHYGSDHFNVGKALGNLGDCFGDLGYHQKQKDLLERSLEIVEKHYESDNIAVAVLLMNLATAYGCLGDTKKEKDTIERALEIYKIHYGPEHFKISKALNNLGNCYGKLGHYRRQKELIERAIEIDEEHYGPDHSAVGMSLVNLGNAYGGLGYSKKQKKILERALTILEKFYGSDHIIIAKTLVNLSNAYRHLGDIKKQKDLLQRALKINKKYYVSDHYELARNLENLGTAYGEFGDHQKEKELIERALEIKEKHYGSDHYEIAFTLENLSSVYGHLGDPHIQNDLLRRALKIREKYYGSDHIMVAKTLGNLGNSFGIIGNFQTQKQLLKQSLAIKERYYGPEHVEVARTLVNLSNAHAALGDAKKQKALLEKSLPILEKHYGSDNLDVAKTLNNLGHCYVHLGDPRRQIQMQERALTIQEKFYGADHVKIGISLVNLSNGYAALGDTKTQKNLLERALPLLEKHYRTDSCIYADALFNLSIACEALGDNWKQKELLERALEIKVKYYTSDHFEVAEIVEKLKKL